MSTLAEKRFSYFSSRVIASFAAAVVVNNFIYPGGYTFLGAFLVIGIIWGIVGAITAKEKDLLDY